MHMADLGSIPGISYHPPTPPGVTTPSGMAKTQKQTHTHTQYSHAHTQYSHAQTVFLYSEGLSFVNYLIAIPLKNNNGLKILSTHLPSVFLF